MARYLLLTFCLLLSGVAAFGQTSLRGLVTDGESGEPILFGNVALYKGGVLITGVETDFDGNYSITNLDPGTYDVEASYVGYNTKKVTDVIVVADKSNKLDIQLGQGIDLDVVEVTGYKKPLIEQDNTTQGGILTSDEIQQLPTRNVNALAATTAGVATSDEGGALNIRGSRSNATNYYLDGIRVFGGLPPQQDIDQLQVITGGVPATYGDVTGGIISITSKGPSSRYSGGMEVETSQLFDNYNSDLLALNVSGPIIKKKTGEAILGFRISGQYQARDDDDPPATTVFQVKEAKRLELEENPIVTIDDTRLPAAEFLTNDDVNFLDYRPNERSENYVINGKLDLRLSKAFDISVTGTATRSENKFTPGGWAILNSHNNPTGMSERYRGNVRLRHRIGAGNVAAESTDEDKAKKGALIQNAAYTLQFGYEKGFGETADKRHGDNLFAYGHLGNFNVEWIPTIDFVVDTTGGNWLQTDYTEAVVFADNDPTYTLPNGNDFTVLYDSENTTGIPSYVPSSFNPVLAQYVDTEAGDDFGSINNLTVRNGFVTGVLGSIYGLHSNVGQVYNSFNKNEVDIYTFNVNSSFELVPGGGGRHQIQFGILYEQRTSRNYNVSPFGLWGAARQFANVHLEGQGLDENTQLGEITLPFTDPAGENINVPVFAPAFTSNEDAKFFEAVRQVTGQPVNEYVNVDGINPGDLSLDMFSARELNDQGLVGYYGYDYLGNPIDGVTFEQFFTEEQNGIRTFPIGAWEPNYGAVFIQDKFTFKDIIFRLGLRVDRYDANTKVLKDPYSLYDILGANDFHNTFGGERPGNIGDDYKVYVEGSNEGETVRAYRNGDTWFFANGTQANSGAEIFGVEPVFPRFTVEDPDIQARGFDTNLSFDDYKPQINWMPRLAFSFPISDEANFFAHYDILVQRPPSNALVTPLTYFYFNQRTGLRNNANLLPERTVDYEVGFQQKLSNSSALKLAAYYKELRDMIQSRFYTQVAGLNQYETYDNLDFGTVKGFTVQYDLRRTNNIQLNIAYTLQFADGTGSNANTSRSVSSRGIQRTLFPLNFDERHRVNAIIDYRYGSGKRYNGPRIFGADVFANAGLNLHIVAVSGRPYTSRQVVTSPLGGSGIQGALNGSRLPWNYTLNLRVDKTFALTKPGAKNPLNLNVFLRISNVLDRRNIINVYSVTGSPTDDGYLNSSFGLDNLEAIQNSTRSVESFLASYQWRVLNPNNFSLPRRMFLGASFQF